MVSTPTVSLTADVPDPFDRIHAEADAAALEESLRRVLIVDDEASIRLALTRFLSSRGYDVESAESGHAALEALRRARTAVMLCDLRMPGMSGLEIVPKALNIDPDLAVVMLTAMSDAQSATDALTAGAGDYLVKPVELSALQQAVESALARRSRALRRKHVERLIREEVAARTADLLREQAALRALTLNVAHTLVNAMEAKDVYLRGHSERVGKLARRIAQVQDVAALDIDLVRTAGRLHDIGKIGLREAILHKPGPLTDEEFAHVQSHVQLGLEILAPLEQLGGARDFIRDHHEHWDGSGYPRGLAGDAISWGGRVLTAADAFDALTSKRAYREPMTADAALAYLATQRGRLIEPAMYDALVEAVQVEYRPTA